MSNIEEQSTKFTFRQFITEKQQVNSKWLASTKNMTMEEFKKEMLDICEYYLDIKPKKLLSDATEMAFLVTPDLQEWVASTISPQFVKAGIKKVAFLVPKEIFAQVALEQMGDESKNNKVPLAVQYFDNKEKANFWLEHP